MKTKNIRKAIVYAIAEDILRQLQYDDSLQKMVLPEGAVFAISPDMALLAANELGIDAENLRKADAVAFTNRVTAAVHQAIVAASDR